MLIDDKLYSVVGINGYRQGNLTKEQALDLAKKLHNDWLMVKRNITFIVYYRDGSEVTREG